MNSTETRTLATLAGEAYEQFERRSRDSGEEFVSLKDDAPEWVGDLVREAHGDMFPDDWRYECIRAALGAITDGESSDPLDDLEGEFADQHADVYTAARFAWLASHLSRMAYCDEAVEEGLVEPAADMATRVGVGQYMEAREVFSLVCAALAEELEAGE